MVFTHSRCRLTVAVLTSNFSDSSSADGTMKQYETHYTFDTTTRNLRFSQWKLVSARGQPQPPPPTGTLFYDHL